MDWQQFILQLIVTLIPVMLAYIKQRGDISSLKRRVASLEVENEELKQENRELRLAHNELQSRYEINLQTQAGMRDKF